MGLAGHLTGDGRRPAVRSTRGWSSGEIQANMNPKLRAYPSRGTLTGRKYTFYRLCEEPPCQQIGHAGKITVLYLNGKVVREDTYPIYLFTSTTFSTYLYGYDRAYRSAEGYQTIYESSRKSVSDE